MMSAPGRLLVVLAALVGGCVKLDSYACLQSAECQRGDLLGTCEPGGVCSFPDPACASGKKFGELAGEQSGLCVGETGGTTTTTATPTTSTGPGLLPTGPDLTSTGPDLTSTTVTSEVTSTTSTTSTGTTDADTTGPTCGEVGEPCVDGACCGACAVCGGADTCVPLSADEGAAVCGVCSFCGGDGECAVSPEGSECQTDCSAVVWQEQVVGARSTCYAWGAKPVASVCDGAGACAPVDPVEAGCPDPALLPKLAVKLVECDTACLELRGPCVPGGPADAVDLDSYCELGGESPTCHATCSADQLTLEVAECDQGVCTQIESVPCGDYFCDSVDHLCPDACVTDADCVIGTCQAMQCM